MNRRASHIIPFTATVMTVLLLMVSFTPSLLSISQFTQGVDDSGMEAMSCNMEDGMCSCSTTGSCSCSMDMGAMSCNHDAEDGPSICGCSAPQNDWFTLSFNGLKAIIAPLDASIPTAYERFAGLASDVSPPEPYLKKHKPPA